ncbi:MAG: ribonuclease P protein component [candidate division WOR-3 bacterium]|nr:ribonuclease P protein component [candidate division WOR-3 bacterium]
MKLKNFTLKKWEIIRYKKEIEELKKKGKAVGNEYLTIIYLPKEKRKVLFSCEKSIKKAVKRNKLRRRLREIYRTNKECFKENYYFWIIGKERALELSYNELKEKVLTLMKNVK